MTSGLNISAVVPGRGSYRDRPIAWIWMSVFVAASFKKVRYKLEVNPMGIEEITH